MIKENTVCLKLNIVLSNGLCVLNAKPRKNSHLWVLFATDFNNETRLMFDMERKTILPNKDRITLATKDVETLITTIQSKLPKKEEIKKDVA